MEGAILVVLILIGLSVEWQLSRLRRIGLAINEKLKEIVAANAAEASLSATADSSGGEQVPKAEKVKTPPVLPEGPPGATKVYRI